MCFLVASSNQIIVVSLYTSPDEVLSLDNNILLYGRLQGVLAPQKNQITALRTNHSAMHFEMGSKALKNTLYLPK